MLALCLLIHKSSQYIKTPQLESMQSHILTTTMSEYTTTHNQDPQVKPSNQLRDDELDNPRAGEGEPVQDQSHKTVTAARSMAATEAWTPKLCKRPSWSLEEYKHEVHLSHHEGFETSPTFVERSRHWDTQRAIFRFLGLDRVGGSSACGTSSNPSEPEPTRWRRSTPPGSRR
jgi:hypothetical protein